MAPFSGRRAPPQQQQQQQPARAAAPVSRNAAFEDIFGRRAEGHHMSGGPPPAPGGPGQMHRQGPPPYNPYTQPMPPLGAPSYPRMPPGAPGYPPMPPQQRTYPPGPPGPPGPGQQAYPARPPVFDGAPSLPPNMNGYPRPPAQRPPNANPQLYNDESRRVSLSPSVGSSMYANTPGTSRAPSQTGSSRAPSLTGQRRPPQGYAGGFGERLPQMSVMEREEPDPYGGIAPGQGPPQGQPQPSSSSVYNMPVGNRSQTAMATGSAPHQHAQAPRSHSMHNTGGRPQMTPVNTSQLPSVFPEPLTETPTSADYTRMMGQMSMSGRGTPGPLDDIAGIPDRSSGDLGALKGPWEQQTQHQHQQRPAELRHISSDSATATRHHRMPSDSSIGSVYTVGGRVAPLSQIGGANDSPHDSPATPTGSENGYYHHLSRKSMESTHSLPLPNTTDSSLPPGAATSAFDHRATSFSGNGVNRRDVVSRVRSSQGSLQDAARASYGSPVHHSSLVRKQSETQRQDAVLSMPVVPALLSTVAAAFRQVIQLGEIEKEGVTYKDAFDGKSAVTILMELVGTPDRNLALLVGRALDAQKFFHDVIYVNRLRDTANELYQFRHRLVAPLNAKQLDSPSGGQQRLLTDSESSYFAPTALGKASPGGALTPVDGDADDDLPNGVFTLLTSCYSPTCSKDRLCYSINCPRREEQKKRLNMKDNVGQLRKAEEVVDDPRDTGATLWIHSVSQEIIDSVDDTEKKRQEAINEVMYTERDFVRDLEYLRDSWVQPLRTLNTIPESRRDDFVRQVFWNVHEVLKVNQVLGERLTKRQKQHPVVAAIGDIFLECVPHFEPFVKYGAHQIFGKYEFEKEKSSNPEFQRFVDETERKPESRKLELNGYLTKPTTRLGRYPLLLEAVLKYTPADHPDKHTLPEAIKKIREFLSKVNEESGKSESRFELRQIDHRLVFRSREDRDSLRLNDANRQLLHKGPMKLREGENADLQVFLMDNAMLFVKQKWAKNVEQLKVFRSPIPLDMLVLLVPEEEPETTRGKRNQKGSTPAHVPPKPDGKYGYLIQVQRLGRKAFSMPLWVETHASRKKWLQLIEKQQLAIAQHVFTTETINNDFFGGLRGANCISPYDHGNRMIYGTDEGVYFSNLRDPKLRSPVKVINLPDVTQVDVLEEFQLLIVLHERTVNAYPLDCLDPNDPNAALKKGKRIASHTSFFKTGTCLGRTLVVVVKSSTLSSTIKVLEPNVPGARPQGGLFRSRQAQEPLKVFKEFYIPLESFNVHFLKTKLCVGCSRGFEIVDLTTLDMQSLLDPADPEVKKITSPTVTNKPMAMFRVEGDFLLCFDDVAFFINKNGWRSRAPWFVRWEGQPTAFALRYPYLIAFEPSFVEIRHVETGDLIQVIKGKEMTCLFAETPASTVNAPPPRQQLMYGGGGPQGVNPYGRPPQYGAPGYSGPHGGIGGGGFPQPQPYARGGPMGAPPPHMAPAPARNFAYRPEIIFMSTITRQGDKIHHVQFLKPMLHKSMSTKTRRPSDSRSTRSFA